MGDNGMTCPEAVRVWALLCDQFIDPNTTMDKIHGQSCYITVSFDIIVMFKAADLDCDFGLGGV